MEIVGNVTVTETEHEFIYSDEGGNSYAWPRLAPGPTLEIDPRVDLTKPIWSQVKRLAGHDRTAAPRQKRSEDAA